MSRPHNYQVEAIIIRKTKLGEADRILHLYTSNRGKIAAVAKGVRRPRSRTSGHLEILTCSRVALARGRTMDTIIGCQTVDAFLELKNELRRGSYGLYAAEMVDQFTAQGIENPALYSLLRDTLRRFCNEDNLMAVKRFFEFHLLTLVGYRPQLDICSRCHHEITAAPGVFIVNAGNMICASCYHNEPWGYPLSEATLRALQLFQEDDFDLVRNICLEGVELRESEGMMKNYMEYLLEKELKTASWLETIRRLEQKSSTRSFTLSS